MLTTTVVVELIQQLREKGRAFAWAFSAYFGGKDLTLLCLQSASLSKGHMVVRLGNDFRR